MTETKGPPRRVPELTPRPVEELEFLEQLQQTLHGAGFGTLLMFVYRRMDGAQGDTSPSTEEALQDAASEAERIAAARGLTIHIYPVGTSPSSIEGDVGTIRITRDDLLCAIARKEARKADADLEETQIGGLCPQLTPPEE